MLTTTKANWKKKQGDRHAYISHRDPAHSRRSEVYTYNKQCTHNNKPRRTDRAIDMLIYHIETRHIVAGPRYTQLTSSAHTYNNKQRRTDRAIDMLIYHIETRHIVAGSKYTQLTSSAHTYNNKQRRTDRAIDMLIYHIETRHIVAGPMHSLAPGSAHIYEAWSHH